MAKVKIAEVVRLGDKLVMPDGMDMDDAIKLLQAKKREEEEAVDITRIFQMTPPDGAWLMWQALQEVFGIVVQESSWLRNRTTIQVVVDHTGKTMDVPWGEFSVPGVDGYINTGTAQEDGRLLFRASATVRGKHSKVINKLFDRITELSLTQSLYRGRAMEIKFTDESNGRLLPMPVIKFINLTDAAQPVFAEWIEETLDHDLAAYIKLPADTLQEIVGAQSRGVLLAGPFGSGKTMLAKWIGKIAVEAGFTFEYVGANDVIPAIAFAKQHSPTVLFVEDIDRLSETDQKKLQNALDSLTAKGQDHRIVSIFTTNYADKILEGLLRHGRIDLTLEITYPDEKAAVRVAAMYAGQHMAAGDYAEAGRTMAGLNPATIREIVSRAKVRAASTMGPQDYMITSQQLAAAARAVRHEREFLTRKEARQVSDIERGMELFGQALGKHLNEYAEVVLNKANPDTDHGHSK